MKKARTVSEYAIRVCVAGSRSYNNYIQFCYWVDSYIDHLSSTIPDFRLGDLCFISGAASRGPDDMIIQYRKENNYPCFEYEADWDEYGKAAGFIRNAEMRDVCTHLLAFWDGVSAGTEEMIRESMAMDIEVATIIVKPDEVQYGNKFLNRKKYHEKQKGGRAKYPRRY